MVKAKAVVRVVGGSLVWLSAGGFFGACARHAKPAVAKRWGVEAAPMRRFLRQDWIFANNKFFLWKEAMTPEHASQAMAIGRDLDRLDADAFPLTRRHSELEALIDPLQHEKKQLQAKLAGEKETDETAVKENATVEAKLAPLTEELDRLESRQATIESSGREKVEAIMQVVDLYKDQPSSVTFQFASDGHIDGSITGWNLDDDAGPRSFTTQNAEGEKPTMGKISYDENGGVFTFEAYVYEDETQSKLRETYAFRVGRVNYDAPDGRQFFKGEIVRTRWVAGKAEIRRGVAKLVDRNN